MLRSLRKKAQSWMIKVLFAIIIVVFVLFYGFRQRSEEQRVVAEVNGTKITDRVFTSEYKKAYQSLARLYQSIYKDRFDDSIIDRAALGQRVLNELIDQTLITQEAERLSLEVSPEELQAAVRSTPAFQVDGKFNQQRFLAILQMNEISVEAFQEMENRQRLIVKLADLIGLGGVELSEEEILDAYRLEKEKINLRFVRLDGKDYEGSVSADKAELEAYYLENSALFETPPKVQVQYMVFRLDDFLRVVEISEQEVREEYDYDLDRFRVPRRVKVSHILIKKEGEGEEQAEEARKRAEEILEEATRGIDFAALARDHSEDAKSAKQGGSIGWLTRGARVPDFAEAAFSLKKGEIAPLVESDEGFHIVKAEDVQEDRLKSLKEVERQIRDELERTQSRQLAEDAAQEAFFAVYETKDLEGYAAETGRELKTTGLFSRNEGIAEIKGNMAFNEQAFSLPQGEVSSPLRIGEDIYLMKAIKRERPRIPVFEEVKEKVRSEVLQEKALERAKSSAQQMLEEIKRGASLVELAETKGMKVEETGLFPRGNGFVPEVGPAQDIGPAVFSLSSEGAPLKEVVASGGAFFIIELKEAEKIAMEAFESEKEAYRKGLLAEKKARILREWLNRLRQKSEITIKEEDLRL